MQEDTAIAIVRLQGSIQALSVETERQREQIAALELQLSESKKDLVDFQTLVEKREKTRLIGALGMAGTIISLMGSTIAYLWTTNGGGKP